MNNEGSVPVIFAAKVYGKDPQWVRAGIITGYLPIGTATRKGKRVTSIEEMDSKFGRINYYISPKLFYEHTGVEYVASGPRIDEDLYLSDQFITKDRYLELHYFCRQYKDWERLYNLTSCGKSFSIDPASVRSSGISDPTAQAAISALYYKSRMDLVKKTCNDSLKDSANADILLKAVTTSMNFGDILNLLPKNIDQEEFKKAYRKFFVLLHKRRN